MQQTASISLNNITYDVTVKCVTYFKMYYYLMQVLSLNHKLPKDLHGLFLASRPYHDTILHPMADAI